MSLKHKNLFPFAVASVLVISHGVAYSQDITPVSDLRGAVPASPAAKALSNIPLSKGQITATGRAKVTQEDSGLRLQFDDPFHDSGLELTPPTGQQFWDFSAWRVLAVDVENLSADSQMRLLLEVSAGADKASTKRANSGIGLNPGEKRTLRLPLPHRWKFASPEGVPGIRTLDTSQISKLYFTMQWPFEKVRKDIVNCRLTNLRLEESLTPNAAATAAYVPFIDEYGQFMHADWLQKIRTSKDLKKNREQEERELKDAKRPTEWDRFGGWKNGPQLKATGNFRTEKYQGKWYLVDPEGRLFISQGINVINQGTEALKVMPGKENWFQTLPTDAKTYGASRVSLQQKYGTDNFLPQYFNTTQKRLEAWGMNTIGDWSSHDLMALGKTPYTLQLTDYDYKMPKIGGSKLKFYDVFDPAYIQKMKTLLTTKAAQEPQVAKSLTDPMCIGYFIDNELNFGNRGRMTLVDDIMKSPPQQAAKLEFVRDLKQKYTTIEMLNTAWGTNYDNWEALPTATEVPQGNNYKTDAQVFFLKCVDQYFRLANEAVKSVAPHRLYLGARFISTDAVRPALYEACKKYSDILSVNVYAHSVANFPVEGLPDMPFMVTEFQFGVLQRGMFSASLCQAGATPEDRALAYTRFMQGVLVHPNMVGAHWFQYRDQPLTGRGDGEAYQIGFVDVADTPYPEMTQAARLIGENMYQYRTRGELVNAMK